MRLESLLERIIFGQATDEMLWNRVRRKLRRKSGTTPGDSNPEAASASPAKSEKKRWANVVAVAVQWTLRVWRWYKDALSWVQARAKELVTETKDDIWPWVMAFAGYRLQTGELKLRQVPGYVGAVFAYPVKRVAHFSKDSTFFVFGVLRKGVILPFVAISRVFTTSL